MTFTGLVRTTLVLFLLLSLAGCKSSSSSLADIKTHAFSDLRSDIDMVITDNYRKKKTLALINDLEQIFLNIAELRLARAAKFRALNADYDTPKEEFMNLYEEIRIEVAENQKVVSSIHRQFLTITTEDEWSQLSKSHSNALDSVIAFLQT